MTGEDVFLLLGTIPAEIGQITINLRQGNGTDKCNVHIHNRYFIPGQIPQRGIPGLLQISEEITKVQEIFVHSFLRVSFDCFMIRQEVAKDPGRLISIIHHMKLQHSQRCANITYSSTGTISQSRTAKATPEAGSAKKGI